ncbi:MAG: DUF4184 family protein [Dehalococcoidia bacterium]|nr:DUF4184 family protein [Dehalococcoidia bacterium]
MMVSSLRFSYQASKGVACYSIPMPITPVHMGTALAAKVIAPRYFSFVVFGITQVAIDAEAAFYLLTDDPPYHRILHTYLGATVVALLAVVIGRPLLGHVLRLWNRLVRADRESLLWIEPRVPLVAAASGALIGGYSHVLLDSFLYSDMHPISPLSDSNAMLTMLSTLEVYALCFALGLLGAVALAAKWLWRRCSG